MTPKLKPTTPDLTDSDIWSDMVVTQIIPAARK
jgi:hypothetical protein